MVIFRAFSPPENRLRDHVQQNAATKNPEGLLRDVQVLPVWQIPEQPIQSARAHGNARRGLPRLSVLPTRVPKQRRPQETHFVQTPRRVPHEKTKEN